MRDIVFINIKNIISMEQYQTLSGIKSSYISTAMRFEQKLDQIERTIEYETQFLAKN